MKAIVTEDNIVVTGVKKLEDADQITKDVRLFYEVGFYDADFYMDRIEGRDSFIPENWKSRGIFLEIYDPIDFKNQAQEEFKNPDWVAHHNFVIGEDCQQFELESRQLKKGKLQQIS